jgi:hypothetical protein
MTGGNKSLTEVEGSILTAHTLRVEECCVPDYDHAMPTRAVPTPAVYRFTRTVELNDDFLLRPDPVTEEVVGLRLRSAEPVLSLTKGSGRTE